MSDDVKVARILMEEKTRLRELEMAAAEKHLARLREVRRESIETSSLHLDALRDLKRIASLICSVAYPVLAVYGERPKCCNCGFAPLARKRQILVGLADDRLSGESSEKARSHTSVSFMTPPGIKSAEYDRTGNPHEARWSCPFCYRRSSPKAKRRPILRRAMRWIHSTA
jgi:hypothetical protein